MIFLLLLLVCLVSQAAPFTVVMLPDTQVYCREYPEVFYKQTAWIAANVRSRNIRFVTHVGDIVDGNAEPQWAVATRAMSALDRVVPWGVAIGNHDYDDPKQGASPATVFLRHFGPARFRKYRWYRGASPNGLNSAAVFKAGSGLEILVLHLELDYPDEAIRWAEGVLKANRGRPAILVTHAYLVDRDKARGQRPYLRAGGNSAEQLWDKLIRRTPQIFMVLCGHYARPGEYRQVSVNDSGGQVIEIIADYQFRSNGGDGWLTLLTFDTRAGRIQVKTYSPWLDRFETDADSQFDFPFPAALRRASTTLVGSRSK